MSLVGLRQDILERTYKALENWLGDLEPSQKEKIKIWTQPDPYWVTVKLRNRKKVGGSIIHTSSMFGLVGGPNRTVYSMTKFGIEGLTKGMAVDLAKYNIRVNSVCPTFVATPRAKKYLANKKFNKYALNNIPLGRIATESDVATAITFLSSNAASMITGTNIIIDGGWTAK